MRRGVVSALVGMALVGSVGLTSSSHAGTVDVGGNTSVEMFGLVNLATGWMSKITMQGNGVSTNSSYNGDDYILWVYSPKAKKKVWVGAPGSVKNALDKTSWNATSVISRLGFRIDNKAENISAVLSGDFWGTPSYPHGAVGLYRLRRAYVEHEFSNGMYILFGQDADVGEIHNFSMAWQRAAGFNMVSGSPWAFSPQIRLGGRFSIGSESFADFKVALEQEDYVEDHINSLGTEYTEYNPATNTVSVTSNPSPVLIMPTLIPGVYFPQSVSIYEAASVNRRVFPTVAADIGLNLATGFGKPMRLYSFGFVEPVILSYNKSEHSKNSYGGGVGIVVPVSDFTFQSEYIFTRGATGMAGVKAGTMVPVVPPKSYVYNSKTHKLITRTSQAFSVEAKFQPFVYLGFSGGYYQLNFFNDGAGSDTFFMYTGKVGGQDMVLSEVKSVQSIFANVVMYTSHHTGFVVEWDRVITKYALNSPPVLGLTPTRKGFDTAMGNAVWFGYTYVF